jgi:hypothetical protein
MVMAREQSKRKTPQSANRQLYKTRAKTATVKKVTQPRRWVARARQLQIFTTQLLNKSTH